jgi:hypothetical protein
MKKAISVHRNPRGRPATGQDPLISARVPVDVVASIKAWGNAKGITRSEAIRRLVELGLTVKPKAKQHPTVRADRAKELATKAIEKIIDPAAPPEERAQRRLRLTKGPSEFREDRVDLAKAKRK